MFVLNDPKNDVRLLRLSLEVACSWSGADSDEAISEEVGESAWFFWVSVITKLLETAVVSVLRHRMRSSCEIHFILIGGRLLCLL